MKTSPVMIEYLEDAIDMERQSSAMLKKFAEVARNSSDAAVYREHLTESESQRERLAARLIALGHQGENKDLKTPEVVFFAGGLRSANLDCANAVRAYASECFECAAYEHLIAVAVACNDSETAALAREIQSEEEAAARKIYPRIASLPRARTATKNALVDLQPISLEGASK